MDTHPGDSAQSIGKRPRTQTDTEPSKRPDFYPCYIRLAKLFDKITDKLHEAFASRGTVLICIRRLFECVNDLPGWDYKGNTELTRELRGRLAQRRDGPVFTDIGRELLRALYVAEVWDQEALAAWTAIRDTLKSPTYSEEDWKQIDKRVKRVNLLETSYKGRMAWIDHKLPGGVPGGVPSDVPGGVPPQ